MNSSLLSLYVSVLVPVLSEWIQIEDLCFLDSAICSLKLRTAFLETLKFCYCSDLVCVTTKSFKWIVLRSLRVRKFRVVKLDELTQREETILQAGFLTQLEGVKLEEIGLMERFGIDASILTVSLSYYFDDKLLKRIGQCLTKLILWSSVDVDYETIAACCPGLKEISSPNGAFILPVVDACELDVINNCHLGSLVKRQKCDWYHSCSLVRTYEGNDNAVCLGERKYYHMTQLICWSVADKDYELLTPLITSLTKLQQSTHAGQTLTTAAVGRCFKLTDTNIAIGVASFGNVRLLLQLSKQLRRLLLESTESCFVDTLIDVVSHSCPHLQIFRLIGCSVTSGDIMSALFTQCRCLTEFSAKRWPYDSVLAWSQNLLSLCVGSFDTYKSGRGLRKLHISKIVREEVLISILSKNPDLRSIELLGYPVTSRLMVTMAESCPGLIKVSINSDHNKIHDPTVLAALGRCHHLETLFLVNVRGWSVKSLTDVLENKQNLRSLTVRGCSLTSDAISLIRRLFPALIYLDLSNNCSTY